jgi:hypothetical protein
MRILAKVLVGLPVAMAFSGTLSPANALRLPLPELRLPAVVRGLEKGIAPEKGVGNVFNKTISGTTVFTGIGGGAKRLNGFEAGSVLVEPVDPLRPGSLSEKPVFSPLHVRGGVEGGDVAEPRHAAKPDHAGIVGRIRVPSFETTSTAEKLLSPPLRPARHLDPNFSSRILLWQESPPLHPAPHLNLDNLDHSGGIVGLRGHRVILRSLSKDAALPSPDHPSVTPKAP